MAVIERKFGFPMVLGCIDGTYIPIQQPTENASDYYCYKMKHSLNVQATCNKNGLFTDVDICGLTQYMVPVFMQSLL